MRLEDRVAQLQPASAAMLSYALLRQIGLVLDELSAQGLDVWQDDMHRWHWRWRRTDCESTQPFWAMGEAIVDAVVARFPGAFDTQVAGKR